jgi:hypothetical protein
MTWKNVDKPLVTPQGQVIKDGTQMPPMPGEQDRRDDFTYRTAFMQSLPVMFPHENPGPSGFVKKKRFKLLQRFAHEKDAYMEFTDAEVALMRQVADLAFGTMVYGIVEDWLDTEDTPPEHSEKTADNEVKAA